MPERSHGKYPSQILPTNLSNPVTHLLKSSQSPQPAPQIQPTNLSNLNHPRYADCIPPSMQSHSLYAAYIPRSIQPPLKPLHQPLKIINQPPNLSLKNRPRRVLMHTCGTLSILPPFLPFIVSPSSDNLCRSGSRLDTCSGHNTPVTALSRSWVQTI